MSGKQRVYTFVDPSTQDVSFEGSLFEGLKVESKGNPEFWEVLFSRHAHEKRTYHLGIDVGSLLEPIGLTWFNAHFSELTLRSDELPMHLSADHWFTGWFGEDMGGKTHSSKLLNILAKIRQYAARPLRWFPSALRAAGCFAARKVPKISLHWPLLTCSSPENRRRFAFEGRSGLTRRGRGGPGRRPKSGSTAWGGSTPRTPQPL